MSRRACFVGAACALFTICVLAAACTDPAMKPPAAAMAPPPNLNDFCNQVNCAVGTSGFNCTKFKDYGCWCGSGGAGKAVDAIDAACEVHDKCYDKATAAGCTCDSVVGDSYSFTCTSGVPSCAATNDRCQAMCCACDNVAAKAFGKNKYDDAYADYSSSDHTDPGAESGPNRGKKQACSHSDKGKTQYKFCAKPGKPVNADNGDCVCFCGPGKRIVIKGDVATCEPLQTCPPPDGLRAPTALAPAPTAGDGCAPPDAGAPDPRVPTPIACYTDSPGNHSAAAVMGVCMNGHAPSGLDSCTGYVGSCDAACKNKGLGAGQCVQGSCRAAYPNVNNGGCGYPGYEDHPEYDVLCRCAGAAP